jgi:hypothetical protein
VFSLFFSSFCPSGSSLASRPRFHYFASGSDALSFALCLVPRRSPRVAFFGRSGFRFLSVRALSARLARRGAAPAGCSFVVVAGFGGAAVGFTSSLGSSAVWFALVQPTDGTG